MLFFRYLSVRAWYDMRRSCRHYCTSRNIGATSRPGFRRKKGWNDPDCRKGLCRDFRQSEVDRIGIRPSMWVSNQKYDRTEGFGLDSEAARWGFCREKDAMACVGKAGHPGESSEWRTVAARKKGGRRFRSIVAVSPAGQGLRGYIETCLAFVRIRGCRRPARHKGQHRTAAFRVARSQFQDAPPCHIPIGAPRYPRKANKAYDGQHNGEQHERISMSVEHA